MEEMIMYNHKSEHHLLDSQNSKRKEDSLGL
jgi:hypothetical protein